MKQKAENNMIIVTTGGSGGHIFPAEAIAAALLKQGVDVAFLTDRRGQAFQGLKGVRVFRLLAESVTGRSIFGKAVAAVKLYLGTVQAIWYMYRLKPEAVVGVGGYASIPAVMAAHVLHIPIILHEQNAVLGRANRMLAHGLFGAAGVRFIGTSFQPTLRVPSDIPQIQVGLPVRSAVLNLQHTPYPDVKKSFRLLVSGGSQGARFMTQRLPEALLKLPSRMRAEITLVQQVRAEDMDTAHRFYDKAGFKKVVLKSFFDDMPEQVKKAHLVIGRGGAGTLTELMVIGRPAIIVPLPTAADNHQFENARLFCEAGAGWLVQEKDYEPDKLARQLEQLIKKPELLKKAATHAVQLCPENAAQKMAMAIMDIVKGNKK